MFQNIWSKSQVIDDRRKEEGRRGREGVCLVVKHTAATQNECAGVSLRTDERRITIEGKEFLSMISSY